MISIHPRFKLDHVPITQVSDLLEAISDDFLADKLFLEELFDQKEYINVQTSGSTGTPKKLKLSKTSLLKSAENTADFFNLPAGIKALHCLPSQYIAGKMMWVRALHLGWDLVRVLPSGHPMDTLEGYFDFCAMVPLQAQNTLVQLHRIKTIIIGGAPLNVAWEEKFSKIHDTIYQTYGMTETVTHVAVRKLLTSDYQVLPGITIRLDKRSCLQVKVPYVSNKWITTNDVVLQNKPSTFHWLGRYDHIINSGGIKIAPEVVEKKLAPFVSVPFFIAGIPDDTLGEKLVLIIETKTQTAFSIWSKLFKKTTLTSFEIPKQVYHVYPFIRTNDKINRIDTLKNINK